MKKAVHILYLNFQSHIVKKNFHKETLDQLDYLLAKYSGHF